MTKTIHQLFFVTAFIFCLIPSASATSNKPLRIEVSNEFLELSKEYKMALYEHLGKKKNHLINKKKIEIYPEKIKPIYELTIVIEKADKSWNADFIVFPNRKNRLNFDSILFSKLVDPVDFKHVDSKTTAKFSRKYKKQIPSEYKEMKTKFDSGFNNYLNYVSPLGNMDNYYKKIYPITEKLKAAASKLTTKNQKPHKELIAQFIKDINQKKTSKLVKLQDPASIEKHKDIYRRGLKTLYAYFDRIGNPKQFKITKEKVFNNNVHRVKTNYFLIELIGHNGKLDRKIEMEFYFRDSYGKRYIDEYDITGIHFR